jgi:hypothetical protein
VFVNIIKQMLVLFEIIFNKFILMCLNLNWIIKRDQTTRPGWVLLDPLKKTIHADLQGHVHAPDLFFFSQVLIQVIRLFDQKKKIKRCIVWLSSSRLPKRWLKIRARVFWLKKLFSTYFYLINTLIILINQSLNSKQL